MVLFARASPEGPNCGATESTPARPAPESPSRFASAAPHENHSRLSPGVLPVRVFRGEARREANFSQAKGSEDLADLLSIGVIFR